MSLSELDKEVDKEFLSNLVFEENPILNSKIGLVKGDITKLKNVTAIVNAARPSLLGGGGVDGAIHRAAGPELLAACRPLGGCKHGEAKMTPSFDIGRDTNFGPNRDIHTMEESIPLLEITYRSCLRLVVENDIRRIAFPCISAGAYRFPNREAVHVTLRTIREWLETNFEKIDFLLFCVWTSMDEVIYRQLLPTYFPNATLE